MGHLTRLKQEYRGLIVRLDSGTVGLAEPRDPVAWQGWKEILELLYTEEEAALAAKLPTMRPTKLEDLSAQLNIEAETLRARLDVMCDKGIVMDIGGGRKGSPRYILSPPVIGFFEFAMMRARDTIPKDRMAAALKAYTQGDPAFAREAMGFDTKLGRTLVHETGLGDDPMPDVLEWERATRVVETASAWAVSLCMCRHAASHNGNACDAPQEVCLTLNGAVEFVVRRQFGRAISKEEALTILRECRAAGLVQIADNVASQPTFLCNCCGCCCEQLRGINRWGFMSVNPSGFLPHVEPASCRGCGRCARACPVRAITMAPTRTDGHRQSILLPKLDIDRCIGCGACVEPCAQHARIMVRSARPHVPANPIQQSILMAIERGHLADLLLDGGDRLGARFLRRALEVITSLPVARQLLATEQVRSRFLRAVLKQASARTRAEVAARRQARRGD